MRPKFLLVAVPVVTMIVLTASCNSAPAPAPNPTPNATAPPATGTTRAPRQGQGANGTLSQIDGNTLTLTTAQGTATVTVNQDTAVQETGTGTLADLQAGQSLTVIGTPDANGNIAATSIIMRPPGQRTQFAPPSGATRPPGAIPSRPGNGTNPGFTGRGTSGTIASIDGDVLTLTTAQGTVTVNVSADTAIQKTVTGTVADLQVGQSLFVIGTPDANGNTVATSIVIRPSGGRGAPPAAPAGA